MMAELQFVNTPEWSEVIKRYIRSQMILRNSTYKGLSAGLKRDFDINQSESNLKTKINHGVLGTQLFLQILCVLGTSKVDLSQLKIMHEEMKKNMAQREPEQEQDNVVRQHIST